MSLLRDIQNLAVNSNESIGMLLRKCKILAARLGHSEFKNWVECELNGYKSDKDVPVYRNFVVMSKGFFVGPGGVKADNTDIPMTSIPQGIREELSMIQISNPISSIESIVLESNDGVVREFWPAEITSALSRSIYRDMSCLQAWKVIPVNMLVGLLDIIRSKILDFSLEIEAENPDAGDAPVNSKPVPEEKISQIFNTYITGNVQNVATGSSDFTQNAVVNKNNQFFDELLQALAKVDSSSDSKDRVMGAVEEMRDSQGTSAFKDKYNKFISVLADHMQVYGPVVAPFLPTLSSFIS